MWAVTAEQQAKVAQQGISWALLVVVEERWEERASSGEIAEGRVRAAVARAVMTVETWAVAGGALGGRY